MKKYNSEVINSSIYTLLGENIIVFCRNYIYSGKLIGVDSDYIILGDARIVYDTGPLCGNTFTNAQSLPSQWFIQLSTVESYGISGR